MNFNSITYFARKNHFAESGRNISIQFNNYKSFESVYQRLENKANNPS